jgi:prepilin-type processing-associated H-X9-DG protein/prepilin-type N-terminal cleavage/methylation domain-containing protein
MWILEGRMRRARGFTLVEIIVVVGILAVLVALLLPALVRARRSAQRIACASNLRQIAVVQQFYLNEFRDYYLPMKWGISLTRPAGWPPLPPLPAPTVPHVSWPGNPAFRKALSLRPGNNRVPHGLICPGAVLALRDANANGYTIQRSYGYNTDGLSWHANPPVYFMGYKRKDVRSPSRKLMFADATGGAITRGGAKNYDKWGEFWGLPPGGGSPVTNITAYRHEKGANVAFWDGHVQYLRRDEIIANDNLWRVKRR